MDSSHSPRDGESQPKENEVPRSGNAKSEGLFALGKVSGLQLQRDYSDFACRLVKTKRKNFIIGPGTERGSKSIYFFCITSLQRPYVGSIRTTIDMKH